MKKSLQKWIGTVFLSVMIPSVFTSVLISCDTQDLNKAEDVAKGDSIVVKDSIVGNVTWKAENQYLLKGFVYVTKGSALTIEPGTVIKGDKESKATLVVEQGAKIYATGTQAKPIVFTSAMPTGQRDYGDWGGVILCGYAPVNATAGYQKIEGGPRSIFGGTNASDNSGKFQYVRIEFAGVEYATDNEINGLTLGGVGSGTTVDHIQVSYSGDDSYEWFGGSVNAKYLVAFRGWDDEFDTDNGFNGKLQFLVGLRDPNVADKSKSNGFESDNDANGSSNSPYSNPIFSNVSLFGPYTQLTDVVNPTGGSSTGSFQAAMHLRRNTKLCCFNSVFAGWPKGLFIENGGKGNSQSNAAKGDLVLSNNILAGMIANYVEDATGTAGFNAAYWTRTGGNNSVLTNNSELGLCNPFSLTAPKFYASSTSSAVYGKSSFINARVTDSFFTKVSYVGAFGTEDWTEGWCNFNPQNTKY